MRIPYAAKTLISQMQQRNKNAKGTPVGDPDGFNVQRTVAFDKNSSKFLARVLPELDDDRISSFEEKDGVVEVTFSPRTNADQRDEFPLAEAEVVAGE